MRYRRMMKIWKKRIYDCMIKITLIYGSETWRIKEQVKRKLEATEMNALRRAARTSRLERIQIKTIEKNWAYKRLSSTALKKSS